MMQLVNMLLIEIWFFILIFLCILFLPCMRKKFSYNLDKLHLHYIERNKWGIDFIIDFMQINYAFIFGIIPYIIIQYLEDAVVLKIVEFCSIALIAVLFPIFVGLIERKYLIVTWNFVLVLSAIEIYIVYFFREELIKCRAIIDISITIFIVSFIFAFYNIIKEFKIAKLILSPSRLWRDIEYRTPRLDKNISNTELEVYTEKYFDYFVEYFKKIKTPLNIEYVNFLGIYKEIGFKKIKLGFILFAVFSIIVGIICRDIVTVLLVISFFIVSSIYKRVDKNSLYRIAFRLWGNEWGYRICINSKYVFVNTRHNRSFRKIDKFVHSYLNIAAFCRNAAFNDKVQNQNTICHITRSLNELFSYYIDEEFKQSWIIYIPLWIAALFEFQITQTINEEVKKTLQKTSEKNLADIFIFLQSFWVHMERKNLDDGPLEFINRFRQVFKTETQ